MNRTMACQDMPHGHSVVAGSRMTWSTCFQVWSTVVIIFVYSQVYAGFLNHLTSFCGEVKARVCSLSFRFLSSSFRNFYLQVQFFSSRGFAKYRHLYAKYQNCYYFEDWWRFVKKWQKRFFLWSLSLSLFFGGLFYKKAKVDDLWWSLEVK